ncbi:MAG: EAL domain-containing protein [Betaproteobacteria bacterium]|nr:EAL domain-containing protein [Betaproteobacteria bacterium]
MMDIRQEQALARLKEQQRQWWAMLEFLPLAIAAFDRDGRTQYVNAKFIELFGYDKAQAPTLNDWWRQAAPDAESFTMLLERWQSTVTAAKFYQTEPEPLSGTARCKGGALKYIEMRAAFVGDLMLATVIDLSQRRELEQAVLRAKEDIERANAEKSQLVAHIARELYSPLNVAMGHAQLLEIDETLAERELSHVAEIKAACGQMLDMIKQLIGTAVPSEAPSRPGREPAPAPRGRILVVEDYEPNRQLIARQLMRLGYESAVAGDGAEALKLWQAEPYALILTDCNMPVMDGLELTARIRDIERGLGGHVPIVAVSANTTQEEIDKCLNAGMDAYLAKPVKLDELEQVCAKFARPPEAMPAPTDQPEAPPPLVAGARLRLLAGLSGAVEPSELSRLAEIFIAALQEVLAVMGACDRADDMPCLARAAHKLKASLRTIGEEALLARLAAIEFAAKENDWPTTRSELPGLLDGAFKAIEAIRVELRDLSGSAADELGPIAAPAGDDWAKLGVLVVDDDAFVREQVGNMLRRLGVGRVRQAGDGAEALADLAAHAGEIDIVLCDLNMPGMDGLEFIRHFAARKDKIGIAFISGEDSRMLASAQELARAQGLHVLGVAVKPIGGTALYGILGRHGWQDARRVTKAGGPEIGVADIAAGIENKQFTAFFQPKVKADSLEVVGLEALARWRHPVHGLIPPGLFIPLAEANGLIEALTMSVFRRALEAGGELHRQGYKLKIAVNYSAQSFGSLALPEFVVDSARAAGLDPKCLIIEVTESGLMSDLTVALEVLSRLRLKGVSLSIDDFGTGYSSMDQLRRIPFSELKIDQDFVRGAAHDPMARSILESSVDMARKLNLVTVAEGVETEEDLEIVRGLGCDLVQGFLVARPMALPDLLKWLERRQSSARADSRPNDKAAKGTLIQ